MKRVAAVGLMGILIVVLPVPARSDTAKGIALGIGAGLGTMIGCVALREAPVTGHAEEDEFARSGWLVGVAGSYGYLGEAFDDNSSVDGLGVNGRLGYRCHSRYAAEVQAEWLDADGIHGDRLNGSAELLTVTANAKGYLLTGRYQPYVLVGGGAMTGKFRGRTAKGVVDETETALALRFGAGIDLYATRHVLGSLEVGYVLPFNDLSSVDYLWFGWGLQYRF